MSENERQPEEKKSGFFVKIKKSFRIGGKKNSEKDSTAGSIAGKSDISQKSNLKYVNLIPASKFKKHAKSKDATSEKTESEEEAPDLVNVSDEVSTSSRNKESPEDIRLDVGCNRVSSRISRGDTKQATDDEEEQLRLYREMHEVRKQMILKEKQFQEEKLKFYKLQLEADSIIEQHNIK